MFRFYGKKEVTPLCTSSAILSCTEKCAQKYGTNTLKRERSLVTKRQTRGRGEAILVAAPSIIIFFVLHNFSSLQPQLTDIQLKLASHTSVL
jgi:hypothetical protein